MARSDLSWRDAVIKVLRDRGTAIHLGEIAAAIVKGNLRKVGATPSRTVASLITMSLKDEGEDSPFRKVGRGEYILKDVAAKLVASADVPLPASSDDEESDVELPPIITSFGILWERAAVIWQGKPRLYGLQQIEATKVDLCDQRGVYILYDNDRVVYIGRATDRPLGQRLFEHTRDRLRGRWNRFSWFGTVHIGEDGRLGGQDVPSSVESVITALEAVLIEAMEPPQNRRRGDDIGTVEFLQIEDPELEKRRKQELLRELQSKI